VKNARCGNMPKENQTHFGQKYGAGILNGAQDGKLIRRN